MIQAEGQMSMRRNKTARTRRPEVQFDHMAYRLEATIAAYQTRVEQRPVSSWPKWRRGTNGE